MAKNLDKLTGTMEYDGLITGLAPQVIVGGGTIKALSAAATLKRGTVLSKDTDGKLAVMANGATPDCILCDDTTVGTADVNVTVYISGCFDPDKVTVADTYALTEADRDTLRTKNIYFKQAMA